jgi:lipoate-protein ligase A
MYHLKLTLDMPAANLALDEELLARAENGDLPGDVLRLWESPQPVVIQGRSSPLREVNEDACRADGVPVLRRVSGGATVVLGPGCLMYAVVLSFDARPELRGIDCAHRYVSEQLIAALAPLVPGVERAGSSDLVIVDTMGAPQKKFSGNSLRVRKNHLLYHGTVLYDFPLEMIGHWLGEPVRQPEYRAARDHGEFVTNLPASREAIEAALIDAWDARAALPW